MGPLVRAVRAVLDPVAEAGHEDTQLGAKAVVLVRLTSLGLTLRTWGQTGRSVWACWLQRLAGQLLTGGAAGELRPRFQAPAMFRSQKAWGLLDSSTSGSSTLLPIVATAGIRQVEGITSFQQRVHSPDAPCFGPQGFHILHQETKHPSFP